MPYNDFYEKLGFKKELERLRKQAYLGYKKEIRALKLMGVSDNSEILEIGCGPGFFTNILLDNFPKAILTSSDFDQKLLQFATSNLANKYKDRLCFVKDDITKTYLEEAKYDFIIARFVFQHLKDPISAIQNIYKLLKPGGKVIIIDIDSDMFGLTNPKSNVINFLNSNVAKMQSNLSGNRQIGRMLMTLLKLSGFINLDIDAVINHSEILGKENFRYNMDSSMIKEPSIKRIIDEYNNFFDLKYSSIMILKLFFAGQKPMIFPK